jgi:hypothetical protein
MRYSFWRLAECVAVVNTSNIQDQVMDSCSALHQHGLASASNSTVAVQLYFSPGCSGNTVIAPGASGNKTWKYDATSDAMLPSCSPSNQGRRLLRSFLGEVQAGRPRAFPAGSGFRRSESIQGSIETIETRTSCNFPHNKHTLLSCFNLDDMFSIHPYHSA